MKETSLTQLIKTYWKEIFLKKWEYLFKEWDDSRVIYLVNNGWINLSKNWRTYLKLWVGELIWEKTFLQGWWKFFAAITDVYSSIIEFSYSDYEKMNIETQRVLIENISIFLSDRIYKMNNILSFITEFNARLVEMEWMFEKSFVLDFFREFINFDKHLILKRETDYFQILDWNMFLDDEIANFIKLKTDNEQSDFQYIWTNYVLFNSWVYYFLFYWNIKVDRYIFKNTLLYSWAMLELICSCLQEYKHNMIMNNIKEDDINIHSWHINL